MTMKGQLCFFAAFFVTCCALFVFTGYNARHLRPDVQDYIEHVQSAQQYRVTFHHN